MVTRLKERVLILVNCQHLQAKGMTSGFLNTQGHWPVKMVLQNVVNLIKSLVC